MEIHYPQPKDIAFNFDENCAEKAGFLKSLVQIMK